MRGDVGVDLRKVMLVLGLSMAACAQASEPDEGDVGGAGGGQAGGGSAGQAEADRGGTAGIGGVAGGAAPSAGGDGGAAQPSGAAGGLSGAGGIAGAAEPAPPAGGQGGPTPPVASCDALLCQDFETGSWGSDWRPTASGAQVVSDGAAHGRHALRFSALPRWKGSTLRYTKPLAHAGALHGRFYMRLSRPHDWGTTFVFQTGGNPTIEFGGKLGSWHLTPLATRQTFGTFPSGKWICVQWQITENPVTLTVSADGKKVGQVAVSGSKGVTSYDVLRFGMHMYHPEDVSAPFDFFLDDIVVDDAPVDCLP